MNVGQLGFIQIGPACLIRGKSLKKPNPDPFPVRITRKKQVMIGLSLRGNLRGTPIGITLNSYGLSIALSLQDNATTY